MDEKLKEKIFSNLINIKINNLDDFKINSENISGMEISNGNVQFSLEIDDKFKVSANQISKDIENEILKLQEINSVTVILTAHKNLSVKQTTQETSEKKIAGIDKIIAVASGKGGVGKSTTSINLAISFKNLGYTVGILDADIYGPSIPKLIGLNKKPQSDGKQLIPIEAYGLQVMSIGFLVPEESPTIWRGPMVISALTQLLTQVAWKNLDFLIIDLPPGTGDIQLSLSQKANINGSVIVSTPQDLALIDARKGLNMFRKVDVPVLGIIENMSYFICPSCNEQTNIFGTGGAKKEAERLGVDFLGAIPLDTDIRVSSDEGKPITSLHKDSPQSEKYKLIAENILAKVSSIKSSTPKIILD